MRVAYVVRFADDQFSWTLDAIRWLAAPGPRRAAHLTFRGPYDESVATVRSASLEGLTKQLKGASLLTRGPGVFRRGGRRIVYLAAESPLIVELSDVAEREFVPHITIYGGGDHGMAALIESALTRMPPIRLRVGDVQRVIVGQVDDPIDADELGIDQTLATATRDVRLSAISELIADLTQR